MHPSMAGTVDRPFRRIRASPERYWFNALLTLIPITIWWIAPVVTFA